MALLRVAPAMVVAAVVAAALREARLQLAWVAAWAEPRTSQAGEHRRAEPSIVGALYECPSPHLPPLTADRVARQCRG